MGRSGYHPPVRAGTGSRGVPFGGNRSAEAMPVLTQVSYVALPGDTCESITGQVGRHQPSAVSRLVTAGAGLSSALTGSMSAGVSWPMTGRESQFDE